MKRFILLLAGSLIATSLHASMEEARKALEQGKYDQALEAVDSHLRRNRDDAEARFLRGLALVLLNRDGEATQVFADLVRDHPELPEPYNNLAVLYARAGQYEQARDALETALIKHPSYATAHENLGDVYATMAQAAWKRAQTLDRNNSMLDSKLALIDEALAGGVISSSKPVVASVSQPVPRAQVPLPKPVTGGTQAIVDAVPATQPIVRGEDVPAPQTAEAAPAGVREAALEALQGWAKAWSDQDVARYLASYSNRFEPGNGVSLDTWKQQRRARLTAPISINIQVLNPQVTVLSENTARIVFIQVYQSNSYADQVSKVMEFAREGRSWRITKEDVRL